ncbi:MAG TPA: type II toxin-antitoxin system Phd/YefM family antitoxin [Spirochaetota bacterium]|nr:type II toxin-antitoxin system Phd/YefM family antitoxin [Spirochaetota bacterium]
MKNISKSQLKPKIFKIFRRIEKTGEDYIITDHGQPVLKISCYSPGPDESIAELRGSVLKFDNPTEPVGLNDWDILP